MLAFLRRPWGLLVALVLAIGLLAVAWYLVSPLFIRTSLVERATPVAAALAIGSFNEIDAVHNGRGRAVLVREPAGALSVRLEDFSVTNGPDLYVYLSRHAAPTGHDQVLDGLNLGRLKATDGSFSYDAQNAGDASQYRSVVVYCFTFRTIFSVATLG